MFLLLHAGLTIKPDIHSIYSTQYYKEILVTRMLDVTEALRLDTVVRTSINDEARAERKGHEQRGLRAWGPRPFILLSNA